MNNNNIPGNNKDKKGGFSPFAYLLTSLLFLVIAIVVLFVLSGNIEFVNSPFGGLIVYLILLIASMAFAAFSFGVMNSYATYSGKQFSGQLKLGGPIVGAALVVIGGHFFLQNTFPSSDPLAEKRISVKFEMKFADDRAMEVWSKDKVKYVQEKPWGTSYDMMPQEYKTDYGKYLRDNVELPAIGETYKAKILRIAEESIYIDNRDAIPQSSICFILNSTPGDTKIVEFNCIEHSLGLPLHEYSWLELCENLSNKSSFSLISETFASVQSLSSGWVVPSLPTLDKKNKLKGTTYTAFTISSNQLDRLKEAQYFTYQIYINDIPIYIDGMTRDDTRTDFNPANRFELSFGLENLDFSGAQLGKEKIDIELNFYSDQKLLETVNLTRFYIALRNVDSVTITENRIRFEWTGVYVIGKREDGYQLFIWSSENSGEIASNKQLFDAAEVKFEDRLAVSVIRPPLDDNKSFGLLVGLYDNAGKIKFTFNREDAQRILSWIKNDVANNQQGIVRKDAYIRKLIGD